MIDKFKLWWKNWIFGNSSAKQKRISIAKDILAQLETKTMVARRGVWTQPKCYLNKEDYQEKLETDPECKCCGIGGCLIAKAKLFNNIKNIDLLNDPRWGAGDVFSHISDELQDIFSLDQLRLIEYAFELGLGAINYKEIPIRSVRRIREFYFPIKDSNLRLKAIYQSIRDHKEGLFVP